MSIEISRKNESFRKTIRQEQLNELFYRMRNQALIHEQVERRTQAQKRLSSDINEKTIMHMHNKDYQEIYFMFAHKDDNFKIHFLSVENAFDLFERLSLLLDQLECVLLIKLLVDAKFQLLFMRNEINREARKGTIYELFQKMQANINELKNTQQRFKRQQISNDILVYLNCLFSLIVNARQPGVDNYVIRQIYSTSCHWKLWQALGDLYDKNLFVLFLAIVDIEANYSSSISFQEYILNNKQILPKIINQITPNLSHRKTEVVSSFMLINSFMKKLVNYREIALQYLPNFLAKAKVVYDGIGWPNYIFKKQNFEDMLETILIIFQTYSEIMFQNHLGKIMRNSQLLPFMYALLKSQAQSIKLLIYQLFRQMLINILINGGKIDDFIDQEIVDLIMEGLNSSHQPQKVSSLGIAQILIHGSDNSLKTLRNLQVCGAMQHLSHISQTSEIEHIANWAAKIYQQLKGKINQNLTLSEE